MRSHLSAFWTLFLAALLGLAAWLLGLGGLIRSTIAAGHLLDWIMGVVCFLWMIVIVKAPWDLYFHAHQVGFELERSRERDIAILPGREQYIFALRRRLLWLAIGAHLLSAAVLAVVTRFSGGVVGYYFAGFYLVSTVFRPAVAGYVYLSEKLRAIGQEVRYPREDVALVRQKLQWVEQSARGDDTRRDAEVYTAIGSLPERVSHLQKQLNEESQARQEEVRELRQRLHSISREFETTVSRLTDNQEVIRGIQAFVRLVAHSTEAD